MESLKARAASILLVSVAAVFALSACDTKREMTEMHDATVEMNAKTDELAATSKELDRQTGELYDALRQGDSLQLRRNALEKLIAAKDPANKLSEAAKYYMSFEFQLWSGRGPDSSEEKRQMLALSAVKEFFKDVLQFIPGDQRTAKPLKGHIWPTEQGNMVHSLNALAAAMHMLNPKQEAYIKAKPEMKAVSVMSLIQDALLSKEPIENGTLDSEEAPEYVREVLANENEAVYLLQARYNYIPLVFLGRATNLDHSKMTAAKMYLKSWELNLDNFNSVQIAEFNLFLKGAVETRDLLKQLGRSTELDAKIVRIYNNMTVVRSSKATTQKAGLETDFVKNLELFRTF